MPTFPAVPDQLALLEQRLKASLEGDQPLRITPREIKALFAREIVERFHGAAAAERAAREFERVYSKGAVPEDVPTVEVAPSGAAELAWAIKQAGLAASTSDARRLVEQGGVEVDGARVTDPKARLEPDKTYLVRVGSKNRRFARIHVKG